MRVKRGTARRAKHHKVLKRAKGFIGRRNSVYTLAKEGVQKAGVHAYMDRKKKKRTMRALWIIRLNAAVRAMGMSYSVFINKLSKSDITVNRKVLSDIAMKNPETFKEIVAKIK
ncbi:MAG: 50S ribosomal protein L20 [Candidatus Berkelbacteria bacterium]